MLTRFFFTLREAGVPVTLTEHLSLLQALEARVAEYDVDQFYWLARTALVKDEKHFDRFDKAFAAHFRGIEQAFAKLGGEIPADWLRKALERDFTEEEKAQIEALGGWEQIMKTLEERLREQQGRHEGGNKCRPGTAAPGDAIGRGRRVNCRFRRDAGDCAESHRRGIPVVPGCSSTASIFSRSCSSSSFSTTC